jgi:hypothetical protein
LHNIVGNGSTPLVRKRCLKECGGFNPKLRAQGAEGLEDLKLWLRIAERYDFAVVPEFLVGYRQSTFMSKRIRQMRRAHRLILAEARARHPELPRRLFRWSRTKFLNWTPRRTGSEPVMRVRDRREGRFWCVSAC